MKKIKKQLSIIFKYFGIYVALISYYELLMFIQTGAKLPGCLFFVFLLPAFALLFTTVSGFYSKKISDILLWIYTGLLAFFYLAQTIYFRNFGSLFSVSMAGMGGDAAKNFGWAVTDTIKKSVVYIILLILPVIALVVLCKLNYIKNKKYKLKYHVVAAIFTIVMGFLGIMSLRAFGNDRQSPYYLLTDSSVNTDTAAKKLGVLTTSTVESIAYYFGNNTDTAAEFKLQETSPVVNEVPQKPAMVVGKTADETVSSNEAVFEPEPWVDERIDFGSILNNCEDGDYKELTRYFASKPYTETNEYTGLFEGYNLIYICAEGFWSYACNEEVTPTLYKMANNGIILNNYYNSMKNTTTNGEFAFATSLWPDVSRYAAAGSDVGSFPRSASVYMPQGLGDLFTEAGIPSYAFHNYYGKYYRRILSWPNLGYTCKFTGDGMTFTSNWPSSDLELMEQSVDDYIGDEQFHAYYMTFSGHGPYTNSNYMYNKNIGAVTEITGTERYNEEARGYLAGNLELDMAMDYLLERLEKAGKLDKTVIVIAGDHYPYYLSNEGKESLVGGSMDENFDIYKSTCIIYNSGLKEPIVNDNYCCNIDIAPTMLNLFNIPFDSRLMMGKDVFSEAQHFAALYNKSIITDRVRYNYETGEASWNGSVDDAYLENLITSLENDYTASCKIISDNYYLWLYEQAGILSENDVTAEKEREKEVKSKDDYYNAEDAKKEAEKAAQDAAAAMVVENN